MRKTNGRAATSLWARAFLFVWLPLLPLVAADKPPGIATDKMRIIRQHVIAGQLDALKEDLAANKGKISPAELSYLLFFARRKDIVLYLLKQGADVRAFILDRRTLPMVLAQDGRADLVRFYLDKGIGVNQKDKYGRTALYFAAGNVDDSVVKLLLARGAYIDAQTHTGETPLMVCAWTGAMPPFLALIRNGADTHIVDGKEQDVVHHIDKGKNDFVRLEGDAAKRRKMKELVAAARQKRQRR